MAVGKPGSTKKLTQEEAVSRIHTKFPQLDLSEFVYVNGNTPSFVTCPEYGRYEISFKDLMRLDKPRNRIDTPMLLSKFKHIYGEEVFNRYDFSKVEYVHMKHPITIICPTHGEFQSDPFGMLFRKSRTPCKQCNIENRVAEQWDTKESFIRKVLIKYGDDCPDIFDDDFVYLGSKVKTWFKCKNPEHPRYKKRPGDYLNNSQRCTECTNGQISNAEREVVAYCREISTDYPVVTQQVFKTSKSHYRPDIYLPEAKIVIDYHGLIWHSSKYDRGSEMKDRALHFRDLGLTYLQIMEDEWLENQDLVKNVISIKSGLYISSVNADDCRIGVFNPYDLDEFLEENHTLGPVDEFLVAYGLQHEDDIVAALVIKHAPTEGCHKSFEVLRYATSTKVHGGFKVLMDEFIAKVSPDRVIGRYDLRWGIGSIYSDYGFTQVGIDRPISFWIRYQKRYTVNEMIHEILPKYGIIAEDMSEEELCNAAENAGYFHVQDAGCTKWELKLP
jgi:hypothetical protein